MAALDMRRRNASYTSLVVYTISFPEGVSLLSIIPIGPTLALKGFDVARQAANGVYLNVVGRPSGFIGWFLALIGLLDDTSLEVNLKEVRFTSVRLAGRTQTVIPLSKVASTSCGFTRNIAYLSIALAILFIALGCLFRGEMVPAVIGAVLAAVFVYGFWSSQRLTLTVESVGGMTIGLRFKPALIQGVKVDFPRAQEAIDVLTDVIAAANRG